MGRLNHFVHLGVNMISISPIFKTANEEPLYGQDIVDFLAINPTFGELQDLKDLTTAAKQEGNENDAFFSNSSKLHFDCYPRFENHLGSGVESRQQKSPLVHRFGRQPNW